MSTTPVQEAPSAKKQRTCFGTYTEQSSYLYTLDADFINIQGTCVNLDNISPNKV